MIAFPIVSAVYLGVAEAAFEAARTAAAPRAQDPTVQRQLGLMAQRLRVASWALDGALATVGDDPAPSMETMAAVMAAKRSRTCTSTSWPDGKWSGRRADSAPATASRGFDANTFAGLGMVGDRAGENFLPAIGKNPGLPAGRPVAPTVQATGTRAPSFREE